MQNERRNYDMYTCSKLAKILREPLFEHLLVHAARVFCVTCKNRIRAATCCFCMRGISYTDFDARRPGQSFHSWSRAGRRRLHAEASRAYTLLFDSLCPVRPCPYIIVWARQKLCAYVLLHTSISYCVGVFSHRGQPS